MKAVIKKWLPFIVIVSVIIISSAGLFLSESANPYRPGTNNPSQIYREACAQCHGIEGEGSGLIYPSLGEDDLTIDEIKNVITEGAFLMPAFININGDTLEALGRYILERQYKNP